VPVDAERLTAELVDPGRYAVVTVVPSTGSTNADLSAAADDGAADRTVLIAAEQTAGQGRLARTWTSPPGTGLYLSVLLRPNVMPTPKLGWVALLAGVALVRTARFAGVSAALKWPNDLLLGPDRHKGAGVLAEVRGGAVILGVGLNVDGTPADIPAGAVRLPATSLADAGATVLDHTELAARLLTELADLDDAWRAAAGDPHVSGLYPEYQSSCDTLGQRVRVELPNGGLTGIATRLSDDGTLVLKTDDGTEQAVSAGDVVHLRPAS
jgi:BirA family transcriptional regulator, biotin operon repressor / biotin---[acetyl-CoA-carboxylase] ligase